MAKHGCAGKNDCKGQGGCKTSDGGCSGKNSCKGKGGCATDGSKKNNTYRRRAGEGRRRRTYVVVTPIPDAPRQSLNETFRLRIPPRPRRRHWSAQTAFFRVKENRASGPLAGNRSRKLYEFWRISTGDPRPVRQPLAHRLSRRQSVHWQRRSRSTRSMWSACKAVLERTRALWYSDHLCFTSVGGEYFHDLLPLPFSQEAADHVVTRVKQLKKKIQLPFFC